MHCSRGIVPYAIREKKMEFVGDNHSGDPKRKKKLYFVTVFTRSALATLGLILID